jgi:DNA mismatch endonuclease (patch repair protein)
VNQKHPLITDPARSALMKRVRRSNTAPEQEVAEILKELGIHMRRNVKGLPGTPDFANKSRKIAIFVHGCFWHDHRGCPYATLPKRNAEFWAAKIASNKARDRRKAYSLRRAGFRVITVWSCAPHLVSAAVRRLA